MSVAPVGCIAALGHAAESVIATVASVMLDAQWDVPCAAVLGGFVLCCGDCLSEACLSLAVMLVCSAAAALSCKGKGDLLMPAWSCILQLQHKC